jgi:hypothetical protein
LLTARRFSTPAVPISTRKAFIGSGAQLVR